MKTLASEMDALRKRDDEQDKVRQDELGEAMAKAVEFVGRVAHDVRRAGHTAECIGKNGAHGCMEMRIARIDGEDFNFTIAPSTHYSIIRGGCLVTGYWVANWQNADYGRKARMRSARIDLDVRGQTSRRFGGKGSPDAALDRIVKALLLDVAALAEHRKLQSAASDAEKRLLDEVGRARIKRASKMGIEVEARAKDGLVELSYIKVRPAVAARILDLVRESTT